MGRASWNIEETNYLIKNWKKKSSEEIALSLRKSNEIIIRKAYSLKLHKTNKKYFWDEKEIECLIEHWGDLSVGSLALRLKRSEDSIRTKAGRLKLSNIKDTTKYLIFADIIKAFEIDYSHYYKKFLNAGLNIQSIKFNCGYLNMIETKDFWKFAKDHQEFFNFKKLEKLELGEEPEWVDIARKKNICKIRRFWSKKEEEDLLRKIKEFKYTIKELENLFNRTKSAIDNKIFRLGIQERPLYE